MYLMYVDESGDTGIINSPSRYFVLSAIIIHETKWQDVLDDLIVFRRLLKMKHGLLMGEEIHASEFVNGRPKLNANLAKNIKIDILKQCLNWLDSRNDISIVTIRCDKRRGGDIFDFTWRCLIQRFDNTLAYKNFPNGNGQDKGFIIADNTDGGKLTKLLREMRRVNNIPNTMSFGSGSRNIKLRAIVEDPFFKDSAKSYFHQMVDVVAYFARQYYEPNRYVKAKGARTFYTKFLTNVTNRYVTRNNTPNRIVEI